MRFSGTHSAPSRSLSQIRALAAQPIQNDLTTPHWNRTRIIPLSPSPGPSKVIRDLAITEPATLLRAAAIDQAVNTLIAEAETKSQRRAASLTSLPG
jgi:hypothetical protein